ncbi:hypothetical protein [Kribbella koreensis]|uniref:hypothetical protein n=1 Tax=Kribbella koreensis TaxID=57909 RepID=UPI0031DAF916
MTEPAPAAGLSSGDKCIDFDGHRHFDTRRRIPSSTRRLGYDEPGDGSHSRTL